MLSIPLQQQKLFLRDVRLYMYTAMVIVVVLVSISLGLTWFGTNAQISISTTLTYAGRERSLTQQILAESLLTVYAQDAKARKDLSTDELDWTQRHDALWRGDNTLHVLSISSYPDIMPQVDKVEPLYLNLHIALNDVLTTKNSADMRVDAMIINTDAVPFYNAMEAYNTYLRNLTTHYQTTILIYGIISTVAILVTVLLSILIVFRPAFTRLDKNVLAIVDADEKLQKQKTETDALLEEIRRDDHDTRIPLAKISMGKYAVQNGTNGYYEVNKVNGLFQCPCPIFTHNYFCIHVKYAQDAERVEAQQRQQMFALQQQSMNGRGIISQQ
jgi:hypothetical protein